MTSNEQIDRPAAHGTLADASLARHRLMVETPVPRLVTAMAIPSVVSQMVSVIYNTADTYFVARIHTSAAAAVGVVFALMSIIHALGFSIGMGANSLISRRLGAKKNDEAYVYANSALAAAFACGTVIMVAGELTLSPLMRLLGSTETILPFAVDYAKYILLGAPFMCPMFVLNNILRSEGKTQAAMWGTSTGAILNVFLDPLLIFTLDLGIAGAAIATIIGQAISLVILASFFGRSKSIICLSPRWISRDTGVYWDIISTGLPTICRQGMGSLSSAALNILASGYGDAAVAAITIANKIYMLVRHLVLGIGQGMQPVAGYNYGAKNYRRVRQTFVFCCMVGSVICIASSLVLWPCATFVIAWFRDDPAVIAVGVNALLFGCAVMPFMAYSTYTNQLCQVLGFRVGATVLASCRQGIFFFPAAFILVYFFGLRGLEATQPVADFFTFLVSIPYQLHFFKRHLAVNGATVSPEGMK